VGDGDPSGFDIERAAKEGNGLFNCAKREGLYELLLSRDGGDWAWEHLTWERLAITDEDLAKFKGFQLVPVKEDDTRSAEFKWEHRDSSKRDGQFFGAEVEALEQEVLQARVKAFIQQFIDADAWK